MADISRMTVRMPVRRMKAAVIAAYLIGALPLSNVMRARIVDRLAVWSTNGMRFYVDGKRF